MIYLTIQLAGKKASSAYEACFLPSKIVPRKLSHRNSGLSCGEISYHHGCWLLTEDGSDREVPHTLPVM